MEMMGGMLGAITGLIGAGLSYSAQQQQIQEQQRALIFQKQQAAKQNRFAQAGRTDAYGNKQSYDDILNEWIIALTPTQKQITQAGERENLLSLTEDAPRNRRQKQRAEQNALEAGKQYQRVLADFTYDQPKDERAIRDELEHTLMGGKTQAMKDQQGIIARQALRMGKGADLAKIIKATDDAYGEELPELMAKTRMGAMQERQNRVSQHNQQYMPEMQMWQQLMAAGGGDAQIKFSDTPQALAAQQGQMAQSIQAAMESESRNVGGAMNSLAGAMGKSPDLSAVAGAFSKMGSAGQGSKGGTAKYSLTAKGGAAKPNPDENRMPWDQGMDWGSTGDYMNNMDYGDWLF
jgi:hypothetical protein